MSKQVDDMAASAILVFCGPTLNQRDASSFLDATYLPPAAQGDILRAVLTRPRVICIIDGYFETVPSVWHKEILYALEQGIHVFGSSSMGALRALELQPFGMIGHGQIFLDFASGIIEDDDEVALSHGPPEDYYKHVSVPMVNIRATFSLALQGGVISLEEHNCLITVAKDMFFPDRNYRAILRKALSLGVVKGLERFAFLLAWITVNRVDQKRLDAISLLKLIKSNLDSLISPFKPNFVLENTEWIDRLKHDAHFNKIASNTPSGTELFASLINDLRIDIKSYSALQRDVLLRYFASLQQHSVRNHLDVSSLDSNINSFRSLYGLDDQESWNNWLRINHISSERFNNIQRDLVVEQKLVANALFSLPEILSDLLVSRNVYKQWIFRTQHKLDFLKQKGLSNPDYQQVRLTFSDVYKWYVREFNLPSDITIQQLITIGGYSNEADFSQNILKEYIYSNMHHNT